jgi:hypothetical protein
MKRSDEAHNELEFIKDEIQKIDVFLQLWKQYAKTEGEQGEEVEATPERPNIRRIIDRIEKYQAKRLSRKEYAQKSREIILENGEPMTRGELVVAFRDKGLHIGGTDKRKNMGTIMWRLRDKFVNIEGRGYWPKDVAYEAVGYEPEGTLTQ